MGFQCAKKNLERVDDWKESHNPLGNHRDFLGRLRHPAHGAPQAFGQVHLCPRLRSTVLINPDRISRGIKKTNERLDLNGPRST
jgi:hypothetical protein